MYGYRDFEEIIGERLVLKRLIVSDFDEIIANLSSTTSWASLLRGINTKEKFYNYLTTFIDKQERTQFLTIVSRIKESYSAFKSLRSFHA